MGVKHITLMMLVNRDSNGMIQACMEVRVVDLMGKIDPNGEYLWIEQAECNPDVNFIQSLRPMIRQLDILQPNIHTVYWIRRDKTSSRLHSFSRQTAVRFANKEMDLCHSYSGQVR